MYLQCIKNQVKYFPETFGNINLTYFRKIEKY